MQNRYKHIKFSEIYKEFKYQIYDERTEMPEKTSGAGTVDDITDSATYIIHYLYPIKRNSFRSNDTKET